VSIWVSATLVSLSRSPSSCLTGGGGAGGTVVGGAVVEASALASPVAAPLLPFVEAPSPEEPALQAPDSRTAAPTLTQTPSLTGRLYQDHAGSWVMPTVGSIEARRDPVERAVEATFPKLHATHRSERQSTRHLIGRARERVTGIEPASSAWEPYKPTHIWALMCDSRSGACPERPVQDPVCGPFMARHRCRSFAGSLTTETRR
jgi:hypothetical protein